MWVIPSALLGRAPTSTLDALMRRKECSESSKKEKESSDSIERNFLNDSREFSKLKKRVFGVSEMCSKSTNGIS